MTIISKPGNKQYRENYDRIFGTNKINYIEEVEDKGVKLKAYKMEERTNIIFDNIRDKHLSITPKKNLKRM
jgi:hypothetical protein